MSMVRQELIEREQQLRVLNGLLDDCVAGRGRVAVLSGAAGSGKTELLHAFADHATSSGAMVLTAVGSRVEQALPLGVVDQLLHSMDTPLPDAAQVVQTLDEGAGGGWSDSRVLYRLCKTFLDLAEQVPLVVAVDEFHHADLPSQQCLSYVVRRLRSARLLVVLTENSRLMPGYPAFHGDLIRDPSCRIIETAPLSRAGVAQIVRRRSDLEGVDPSRVHAISGGNPLLLEALLADARNGGRTVETMAGDRYAEAVLASLYRSEPAVLEVARGLAVVGGDASPSILSRLLGLEADTAQRAIDLLTRSGMLHDGRYRHPAAGAAVLASMVPDERAVLHGNAARLLHGAGKPARVVAPHLVRTHRLEEEWAVPTLEEAVAHALDDDSPEHGLALLQRALKVSADERQRARILVMVARARWRINPAGVTQHLPELADAVRAGHLTGPQAVDTVNHLLWHGNFDEAAEVLEAITLADQTDPQTAQRLMMSLLWMAVMVPAEREWMWRLWAMLRRNRSVSAESPPLQAARTLTAILSGGSRAVVAAEEVLQRVRLDDETLGPIAAALFSLILADRPDEAADWCHPLLREAATRQAPTWQAVLSAVHAEISLRQGELSCAVEHAQRALTILPPKSWGITVGYPLSTLVLAVTGLGHYTEAEEHLAVPVPAGMFRTHFGVRYMYARGSFYMAVGRVRAAATDFQTCGEAMNAWGLDIPSFIPWRAALAQAQGKLGQKPESRRLAQEQLSRLGEGQQRARGVTLRAMAAVSEPGRRTLLLREATELLQASGDRLEAAWAFADLSDALYEVGDYPRARLTQRTARLMAQQCEALPLLWRMQPDMPSATPVPVPTGSSSTVREITDLSEAERRVAVLAALGHTNREIARKLYVTVSTVEQHLTRVYRKLRVSRRTDLPAGLSLNRADTA